MTRLLRLWLMLAVCFAAGGQSASAAPYHNPGYENLTSHYFSRVGEQRRRYMFWRRWFGREKNYEKRRHRNYERRRRSDEERDVNRSRKRRNNGSRFWGGPWGGYGTRLSHPCERCRSHCQDGRRDHYCRTCRKGCGW
jgi:hypothetical protein